ncbi:hypothetical protein CBS9595_000758 [Malassezia furfur]|nr:hypothetical protein CBS9595_000758 [Malassezia furfur]
MGMCRLCRFDAEYDEFLQIAKDSLTICDKYGATMVINDSVDVAAALPERVGLHIGQDDTRLAEARRRLGSGRLIGISVHDAAQARAALDSDADYAGVGPCWGTQSKAGVTKDDVMMLDGARETVAALARSQQDAPPGARLRMPCVLIGGINLRTVMRTMMGASSSQNAPDGFAVISAIVARRDPGRAAAELYAALGAFRAAQAEQSSRIAMSSLTTHALPSPFAAPAELVTAVASLLKAHHTVYNPTTHTEDDTHVTVPRTLVQTITSHVSSYFSANVALAFSASPIMSHEAEEAVALSQATRALVLNIGTINNEARQGMAVAGPAANARGTPVVLDPVGVGATPFRYEVANDILNQTQVTLIKGNAAEIGKLAGSTEAQAQGVDSVGALSSPAHLAAQLAMQEGALVLLTGEVDYLTNGEVVIESHCGTPLLGRVTATGCSLGVMVAAGLASAMHIYGVQLGSADMQRITLPRTHRELLVGALLGVFAFTVAAERAVKAPGVRGPGTFLPALLDEIASLTPATLQTYEDRIKVYTV